MCTTQEHDILYKIFTNWAIAFGELRKLLCIGGWHESLFYEQLEFSNLMATHFWACLLRVSIFYTDTSLIWSHTFGPSDTCLLKFLKLSLQWFLSFHHDLKQSTEDSCNELWLPLAPTLCMHLCSRSVFSHTAPASICSHEFFLLPSQVSQCLEVWKNAALLPKWSECQKSKIGFPKLVSGCRHGSLALWVLFPCPFIF